MPRSLDGIAAGGVYKGLLREVILRMKQRGHMPLTQAIAHLFACRLRETVSRWKPTLVVPVPMHWLRRWVRGVNNPDILAQALGSALGVPVKDRLVVRYRHTQLQADLSPRARKANVQGAFRIRQIQPVHGARVVLVDDVLTTGATCGELAKLLKQAGASAVWAVVLARTQVRSKPF